MENKKPKIKVCGMKDPENIRELIELPIDMMGLIFYEKSPRYAGNLNPKELICFPKHLLKVGVFVNASEDFIDDKIERYQLNMIQLHGNESPEFCCKIHKKPIQVIKAFSIEEQADLKQMELYKDCCDFFLFDTKTPQYGGSGKKFNWQILDNYQGEVPFFLSGGIDKEDIKGLETNRFPQLFALDLNSKFEIEAGKKNITKLKQIF